MHRRTPAVETTPKTIFRFEPLEPRSLFAAVTFTLDSALSSLRLSGEVSVIDLDEQRAGSLIAAYEGTILADVTDTTITFSGGSNVVAQATRAYEPGDGPANYGGEAETGGIFNVKIGEAAVRGLKFDVESVGLALSESGGFGAAGIDLRTTGGEMEYELNIGGDGDIDFSGETVNNNNAGNATVRGEGANLTLTIPIDINLNQDSAELRLRGTLVANSGTGAPPDPNAVRLGDGSLIKSLSYAEADGSVATISAKGGGSIDVTFVNATTQTPGKTGSVVIAGGAGFALTGIDAVGTTRKTSVAITGKGGEDKAVSVGSVTADGTVAAIGGKGVTLAGPVTVNGRLVTLTAATLNGATITADSIGTVKVTGDVAASTITVDAPFASGAFGVGKVTVGGAFSQSRITAAGAIGPVKATTIIRSEIYSAVSGTAARFPVTTDLSAEGLIGSVTAKNFADSVIAADTIGKMKLGIIVTDNAGTPFGITADLFAGLQATNGLKEKLKLTVTDDPVALTAALAAQTFAAGDFVIRLG